MKTQIAAWSSRFSQTLARPCGIAWNSAEMPYSSTIDPANTLAATTSVAVPSPDARQTSNGNAELAKAAPSPWLMVLAISSPPVWRRPRGSVPMG